MKQKLSKEYYKTLASKYKSRVEFHKNESGAYEICRKNHWLDEFIPSKIANARVLTKDVCYDIAKSCTTRKELEILDGSVYQKARIMGWLDEWFPKDKYPKEYCRLLASQCKNKKELYELDMHVYWKCRREAWFSEFFPTRGKTLTKDICKDIASKCESASEFASKDRLAYIKSRNSNWLIEFFPDMRIRHSYTYDECKQLAAKCNNRTEFKTRYHAAYDASHKNNWIDNFKFPNIRTTCRGKPIITDDDVISVAKKCTTLKEFITQYPTWYANARKRRLISKFTWLKRHSDLLNGFNDNVYVYEFKRTKTAYIGRTVLPTTRDNEHRRPGDSVYEYATLHNMRIPKPKYLYTQLTLTQGVELEGAMMEQYKKNGWHLINKAKAGSVGSLHKYTKKHCIEVAKQYTWLSDFKKNDSLILDALRRHGWIADCTWLKSSIQRSSDWTYDKCHAEALKYKGRNDFYEKSNYAYRVAKKNGWLEKWFPSKIYQLQPVAQYSYDGKTLLATYTSIKDAADAVHASPCNISACCSGIYKRTKGFVWKRIGET